MREGKAERISTLLFEMKMYSSVVQRKDVHISLQFVKSDLVMKEMV
jgi:hypothetical protein